MNQRTLSSVFIAASIVACTRTTPAPSTSVQTIGTDSATAHTASTNGPCGSSSADDRVTCYQTLLTKTLREKGIGSAMTLLEQLDSADQIVRDNSHMLAHSVGLAAFTTPSELAKTFSQCSPNFQSGCYHGLIQAYFLDWERKSGGRAFGADEINGVCKDFHGQTGAWLLFQCVHGLGHGLELIYDHDLPRSLAGCDLVGDAWERSGCYGGAFMENIISVTNPHQMAENIAESGGMDMSGMDMSHMDHSAMGAARFKAFDPADQLYPCSALAPRYLPDCYMMQTSLILFLNKGDFQSAGAACEQVAAPYRSTCFVSLGRDANAYAGNDAERAIRLCLSASPRFRPWCHVGVTKNRVDITSHPSDGFRYCEMLLDDSVSRTTCHAAVGEEIRLLTSAPDQRRDFCSLAPVPFDRVCLYGAGVSTQRPVGLAPER